MRKHLPLHASVGSAAEGNSGGGGNEIVSFSRSKFFYMLERRKEGRVGRLHGKGTGMLSARFFFPPGTAQHSSLGSGIENNRKQ